MSQLPAQDRKEVHSNLGQSGARGLGKELIFDPDE